MNKTFNRKELKEYIKEVLLNKNDVHLDFIVKGNKDVGKDILKPDFDYILKALDKNLDAKEIIKKIDDVTSNLKIIKIKLQELL